METKVESSMAKGWRQEYKIFEPVSELEEKNNLPLWGGGVVHEEDQLKDIADKYFKELLLTSNPKKTDSTVEAAEKVVKDC